MIGSMQENHEYRPVSRLAVLALAAGVCSGLAVFSTVCWAIPLVAIALAVAALADVHREGARKAGGLAALAGLALAVGFGVQAVSAAAVSRWVAAQRAQATALAWIDAVRAARYADAMALADRGAGVTTPPDEDLAVEAIRKQPLVEAVQACPAAAQVTVLSTQPDERGGGSWQVRGTLADPAAGHAAAVTFRIVVTPQAVRRHRGLVERWGVTAVDLER